MTKTAANLHQPVLLESEVPYDEITSRGLNFYERNGFREASKGSDILAVSRRGGHAQYLMAAHHRKLKNLPDKNK